MVGQLSCFVEAALAIIGELESEHHTIDVIALTERLGAREPRLSGFNLDCAAREALRIAPALRRERENAVWRKPAAAPDGEADEDELEEMPPWASAAAG
jgi:hypothetical protein